jgi:hypothetical protein
MMPWLARRDRALGDRVPSGARARAVETIAARLDLDKLRATEWLARNEEMNRQPQSAPPASNRRIAVVVRRSRP